MQAERAFGTVIWWLVGTAQIMMILGLALSPETLPGQVKSVTPLSSEVVQAWRKIGAEVLIASLWGNPDLYRRSVKDERQVKQFNFDPKIEIPLFKLSRYEAGLLASLPDPGTIFGLDLRELPAAELRVCLKELRTCKNLRWLILGDPEHAQALEELVALQRLQALNLDWISPKAMKKLATLNNLRYLRPRCGFEADDVLKELAAMKNLELLDLENCGRVTDSGLSELMALKNLRYLRLPRCAITDTGLKHLAGCSNLQWLDLNGCRLITDEGLKHLAALKNLRYLKLAGCSEITDHGLKHLASLQGLRWLDLSYCTNITDTGLAELAKLKNLQYLALVRCDRITGAGLKQFAGLKNLQFLQLGSPEVTDETLKGLQVLENLRWLDLGVCRGITNAGLKELAALKNLEALNLVDAWQVTEAGLRQLAGLKRLRLVCFRVHVVIGGELIRSDQGENVPKILPNCKNDSGEFVRMRIELEKEMWCPVFID